LDTVIEARPVNDKGLRASGTIIEARPVDDEGLDTVIEAKPIIEDETDVKVNDTYAATQVQVLNRFFAFELRYLFYCLEFMHARTVRYLVTTNQSKGSIRRDSFF